MIWYVLQNIQDFVPCYSFQKVKILKKGSEQYLMVMQVSNYPILGNFPTDKKKNNFATELICF